MKAFALTIFLFLIANLGLMSQDFAVLLDKPRIDKTVLIIPFNTKLYFNDADKEINKATGMTYEQIMNSFRQSFDNSLLKSLNDTCYAISLLNSYTLVSNDDLENLYAASNYSFAEAMDYDVKQQSLYTNSKIAVNSKKEEKAIKKNKGKHPGEVVSTVANNENKYLNVKINDNRLLVDVAKNANADYLLFINQFEIIGNYTNPYHVANSQYNYLVKIHYSLFNFNGKQLFGSFTFAEFPATMIDIDKISTSCFPVINKKIIHNIPLKPEESKK